jgi:hypothetical protein
MREYHKHEGAVNIAEYRYEVINENTQGKWTTIASPTAILRMLDLLGNAYHDVPKIVMAMHDGVNGRTPFSMYRARKHLDDCKS